MEDAKPKTDPYLSYLSSQMADFAKREVHIQQQEERLKTAKEALFADRNRVTAAAQSYREFLAEQGKETTLLEELLGSSALTTPPAMASTGQQSNRVGAKRRKVLEALAEYTADGLTASISELAEMADVEKTLVGNVIWDDRRRGNIETISDGQHRMTVIGFDLLRRIGSDKGKLVPAEIKTPNDLLDRSGQ